MSTKEKNSQAPNPSDYVPKPTLKRRKYLPLTPGVNDLATVNPMVAAEWHPTKNGDLTPQDVKAISTKRVWWKCSADGEHVWETTVTNRNTGVVCPSCGPTPPVVGVDDLATVNPALAAEWHPTKNGDLTPQDVKATSRKTGWWLSTECGHEFRQIIGDKNAGNDCPVCTGRRFVPGINDLQTINPEIAAQWHPTDNGTLTPSKVRASDGKIVWWQCPVKPEHKWQAQVYARNNGSLCPDCPHKTSKAEDTVREYIEALGYEVQSSNRKILKGKEIDIFIPSLNLGVEFNGVYWHSEGGGKKDTQYHYNKWEKCTSLGVELIQIWEDDWIGNPELVLKTLTRRIAALASSTATANLTAKSVSREEAETFLLANDLNGFIEGDHYYGSADDSNELHSVLVLSETSPTTMNIQQYVSNVNSSGDLKELLQYAVESHGTSAFTVTVDNCTAEGRIFADNGFEKTGVSAGVHWYLVRGKRIANSAYTPERFKNDPALMWEEGLAEKELADLNGLNRIWDAGKTHYRLELQ